MSNSNVSPASIRTHAPRDRFDKIRIGIALFLLLISAGLRYTWDLDAAGEQYRVKDTGAIVGRQWMTGMLLGFREAVADMMWIRVDQYFHEGRYDKIMPICYVIAAMDPGWTDVYAVGAWHLGYNFADRRLVPAAINFDKLGVANNPLNYDMAYELGWMEMSRGYQFEDAARNFKRAIDLDLFPVGKTHAWPHALESAGHVNQAIAAWKVLEKKDPADPVPPKWLVMLNVRKLARKNLGKHPIDVHMYLKLVRRGNRVLDIEGVTNLPRYTRIYFTLQDSNWQKEQKRSELWRMSNETLYSQAETTLQPEMGIFDGQGIDFYKGTLHLHQPGKQYDQFPTEPILPIRNGHMIIGNGSFKTTIDMAKHPNQYPLEEKTYDLILFVDPRREPITTQDVIGWNGEGMTGPMVKKVDGYNQLIWKMTLSKKDIAPNG